MSEKDVEKELKDIDADLREKPKKNKSGGLFGKLKGIGKKKKDIEQDIFMGDDNSQKNKDNKIDYDENVITSDEFKTIEKDEKTEAPQIIEDSPKEDKEKEMDMSQMDKIFMKTERLEGRIVAMDELNNSIQERISNLLEEIGELRSSILEKERAINDIESQTKKVLDAFEDIEPQKFRKELEKKETEILSNESHIESISIKQKELREKIDKLQKIMDKVKSFENLVEISEKVNEKFSQLEESKKYMNRLSSKVENIFSELNNRMKTFRNSIEKVEMNEETIRELMKSVDMMQIKVEKVVTKDEIEKIKKEINENIEGNKVDLEDKIYDMKEFLEEIVSKSGGKKFLKSEKIMPWRTEIQKKMEEIEKILGSSKEDVVKIGNFRKDMAEMKNKLNQFEKARKKVMSADEIEKRFQDLEKMIQKMKKADMPPRTHFKSNKVEPTPMKIEENTVEKRDIPAKIIESEQSPVQGEIDIPINVERWLEDNINKGYTEEEMKESLRRGGYNPSYVDAYMARNQIN